jgi:hypothetical protein
MRFELLVAFVLASVAHAGDGQVASTLEPYRASNSMAVAITQDTLLSNDRFWPTMATLRESIRPESAATELPAGLSGVLIRVESSKLARIDFGRDGLFEIPVEKTDLVEASNAVRLGSLSKTAPNFALAIGPRLVDTSSKHPRSYSFQEASRKRGFISVFVDPETAEFGEIARALGPLAHHEGVLTVVFPQARRPDPTVYAKLVELDWQVPFVLAHLSEPYTRILLGKGIKPPSIALQTADGRLLFESGWGPRARESLSEALEAAF